MIGKTISRHRITKQLGSSMGVIIKTEYNMTRNQIIVKLIRFTINSLILHITI